MTELKPADITTTGYQRDHAKSSNTQTNEPVNLELRTVGQTYDHHAGRGTSPRRRWKRRKTSATCRSSKACTGPETTRADMLLASLGPTRPEDRLLDAGSGRGGSGIGAHAQIGGRVGGAVISDYVANFAGLHKKLPDERDPDFDVVKVSADDESLADYLVTTYNSSDVPVANVVGILDNAEGGR
jgi:geranyl diphosphate 2-C-methyltransferase